MTHKKIICLLLILLVINACAVYEPQYKNPDAVNVFPTDKEIEKTFFLIGDAGYSPVGGMSDGLKVLQNYLKTQKTVGNYALFLGDNIYPAGMPPKGHPERESSEYRLDAQYNAVKDYDGMLYFIPGNHDWYNEGVLGLKREEDYFESKIKDRQVFKPNNGCPMESISVSDNIQLILIDSQWYLEDWNVHPTINENCDIKSRDKLFIEIDTELKKNQNKTIIFALHHPVFTNGSHGGYYGAIKHLYATEKHIPLPILASLVTQIRSQGGVSIQDRYNELYNNLSSRLQKITENQDRLIFVSGHEHTLQYIENGKVKQIVSGAGAKGSFASLGNDGLFSSGMQGFAVLDVFKDGSSWVRFYASGGDDFEPKIIYQKEMVPPVKKYDTSKLPNKFQNEITVPIYKSDSLRESLFLKTIWGSRYKEDFSKPVTAKVARLDSLFGGTKVIGEGGDKEYRALRLRDSKGNEYVMKAMGKNSLGLTQPSITGKASQAPGPDEEVDLFTEKDFNEDFYTATHPYVALTIPDMAKAVDIFYNDTQLYYVPKQKALGDYNETYGDELYLIALEPTENTEGERTFKYPDDIKTTDDILTKIRKDDNIFVDEENYIKSRLFDMLIGNWDRESDHWRWAEYKNSYGKNVYVPIPKNRDNAFASFDGNILDISKSLFKKSRQTQIYDDDLVDLEWFNKEGIILDRALLERTGREDWIRLAKNIQDSLSVAIIEQAFSKVPKEVQDVELEKLKEKLINRKENLADIADRYYSYLANLQTVTGTDKSDYFEITRLPDGITNVKMYRFVDGKKSDLIIDHSFNHKDTREIWIYGLDGSDTFEVNGEDTDLIYVRVIGGQQNDIYKINEGRRVKFYDYASKPSTIEKNNKGSIILSDIYEHNTYDYRKQLDNSKRVAPSIGYSPDDGFKIGVQLIYTINSFKRNPFSKSHVVTGGYYFDTNSFDVDYSGEFANSIGDYNLGIGARITSPNYTVNYFGYGNETTNPDGRLSYDYNRVELQTISARGGLIRNSSFGSVFRFQGKFEAITLNQAENGLYQDKGVTEINNTKYFGSAELVFSYRSYDNPLNPARGMTFDLTAGFTENVTKIERLFGYLNSKIVFYNGLTTDNKLVLKSMVQSQFRFGNNFEFHQGTKLGADTGLRGFREERFTGKSSLAAGADIRYSFNEFNIELFPIQIGIYGGVDIGRVWTPSEDSERWHNSRGGGLWINTKGGLGGTFSAFNSKEGTLYNFGLGFKF